MKGIFVHSLKMLGVSAITLGAPSITLNFMALISLRIRTRTKKTLIRVKWAPKPNSIEIILMLGSISKKWLKIINLLM